MLQVKTLFLIFSCCSGHSAASSSIADLGLGFQTVPGQCWSSRIRANGKMATPDDTLHSSFSKGPGAPAPAGSSPVCGASWTLSVAFLTPQSVFYMLLPQLIQHPLAQLGLSLLPHTAQGTKRRTILPGHITATEPETTSIKVI